MKPTEAPRSPDPSSRGAPTHYSGILVVTPPAGLDEARRELDALDGVEVHHWDAPSGRIVVVHESDSLEQQEERLLEIRSLPSVVMAELVYHYLDSDPAAAAPAAARDPQEQGR